MQNFFEILDELSDNAKEIGELSAISERNSSEEESVIVIKVTVKKSL